MRKKRNLSGGLLLILTALIFTSCGKGKNVENNTGKQESGKETVDIAYQVNSYPLAYKDESGNVTGYEIEVMKKVDELLDDYKFNYVEGGTQDAQYTGLNAGRFDIVLSNAFYTEERAETYILPDNPLGASLVGLVVQKGNTSVASFEDVAKQKLSLAPILAGDGLYYVVYDYNQKNETRQIELQATDDANSFMNAISWIAEKRYDVAVWPKNYYESVVRDKEGELHIYNDKVDFVECRSVYTYPVIGKGNEELAKAISEALGKLKSEGELEKLSEKFYGYNAFKYDTN